MKLRWDYKTVDELHELRCECKLMANRLRYLRPLHYGNFPMRRITMEVIEGTVSYADLNAWFPKAKLLSTKS